MEEEADWVKFQRKTFTNWINSYLKKRDLKAENLKEDLADGVLLCNLIEILSGKNLPKWKSADAKMHRLHQVGNLNIALQAINAEGIKLVGTGAEDIVDGNQKLIMGLIWTLIQKFQISMDETPTKGPKKPLKERLLDWVRENLKEYPVKVDNFDLSWQNGILFAALVHQSNPNLFDFKALDPSNAEENLRIAFDAAEQGLSIPKLLDPVDVAHSKPDEQSIMTYVSYFYKQGKQNRNAQEIDDRDTKIAKATKIFAAVDQDHSGFLDVNEFYEALLMMNPQTEKAEAITFFGQVDQDKSGKVTINEFLDAVNKMDWNLVETDQRLDAKYASHASLDRQLQEENEELRMRVQSLTAAQIEAEKYQKIIEDLKHRSQDFEVKVRQTEETIRNLEDQLYKKSVALTQLGSEEQKLKDELKSLQLSVSSEVDKRDKDLEDLRSSLRSSQSEVMDLRKSTGAASQAQQELADIRDKNTQERQALEQARVEAQRLAQQHQQDHLRTDDQLKAALARLHETQSRVGLLEMQVQTTQQESDTLRRQLEQSTHREQQCQDSRASDHLQLSQLQDLLRQERERTQRSGDHIADLEGQLTVNQDKYNALMKAMEERNNRVGSQVEERQFDQADEPLLREQAPSKQVSWLWFGLGIVTGCVVVGAVALITYYATRD